MDSKASGFSRRQFLKTSAAIAAATGLPGWFLEREQALAANAPKRPGPNDRPGIALVGCGGMGRGDADNARRFGDLVAVCDVDKRHAEEAAKQFARDGRQPAIYLDFRKLMERQDVHVIVNGTPDHWHTLINILAVNTGKDVYSEKPLTLTIDEGKQLVKAVRKNQAVFQVGSQQRSDRNFRLACELVRNGRLGKLQEMIVGLPTGPREGPFEPIPVPAELNWDYYLGQAPKMDYVGIRRVTKTGDKESVSYQGRCAHGVFRWWYCFSGGQVTDWGAHHNDIAQWGNGTEFSGPVEVQGKSLVDMIPGGYDAAAEYEIKFKYANGVVMTVTDGKRAPNGVKFIGTEGWIFVARGHIEASRSELLQDPLPDRALRLYRSDDHMGNFFDCVRTRKAPIAEAEIGHRSITTAHLGVISIRMGGLKLGWDPQKEEFTGEHAREANKWIAREMRKPYDYSFIA
ncbi:MAG: Gfo/Idh/MocA family oxidoreductase [Verrucomicrobia bacterium]|nr:Gfo/Idh/MocA family oxidoreductase [Verrucomicrobiota bacterium]